MKKAVSIFLTVSLLVGICAAGAAAAPQDTLGFAVASDLHYNVPAERLEGEIDDPIYWYANRRAAMDNESGFIIDEFLSQCAEDDNCEFVLISGDMADNGRVITQEHYDVAAKFRAFEAQTGKQIYVINGNHDAAEYETSMTKFADFKTIYREFGYDEALATDEGTCSYTVNLGEKYRLIALDSCDETASTEDGMTIEKLNWVHEQTDAAKADGRYPILMMHHNLLDHLPLQRIISKNFIVKFHYTTAELFADWGIKLVLTGHEHCSDATAYTSALGNVIYDFATTALSMYPLEYRSFTLSDSEIKYSAKTIDSIDTQALSERVEGYSAEQLALMNDGLNSYAKGFLKNGIEYRLALSLSMEKMGISEEDIYYDLVYTAVTGLTDILEMPFYGENSVEQLAKEYNIEIPDSEYENGWDLATELVGAHYAGEEAYKLDSTEVTLLLRTVSLILKSDLATVNDEVFLAAANRILANLGIDGVSQSLTKLGASVFGGVTSAEYFLLAIASPILYEFAYDSDAVNDNNGTLPGYATVSAAANAGNLYERLADILQKAMLYLQFVFTYLFRIIL